MNVKILLCAMVIYFVGNDVSAVNKKPHVGYLYEKPEYALEEIRHHLKNFKEIVEEEEEEKAIEEELEEKEKEEEILKEEEEEEIEKEEEKEELEHHHHKHHNPHHNHRHHHLHHLQPPKEYFEPEHGHLKEISSEEGF